MALYMNKDTAMRDNKGEEDGEIEEAEDKVQYDMTKLHDWPGFNIPLEGDYSHLKVISVLINWKFLWCHQYEIKLTAMKNNNIVIDLKNAKNEVKIGGTTLCQ